MFARSALLPIGSILKATRTFTTGANDFTLNHAIRKDEICVLLSCNAGNVTTFLFVNGVVEWYAFWESWETYLSVCKET